MNVSNRTDINSVLAQMRSLREDAFGSENNQGPQGVEKPNGLNAINGVRGVEKTDAPEFGEMLKNAIDGVNEAGMKSGQMQTAFEQGDPNVSLTQVMVSMQKASVSFQAMTQVRNRLVSAYEDIMNMPI